MEDLLTTTSLQKRHTHVYEDFFAQNDLVLSVPQVIDRGYSSRPDFESMLQIKQKIPTKMYLGVTEIGGDDIEFDVATLYNSHEEGFEIIPFSDIYQGLLFESLRSAVVDCFKKADVGGIKISLLSEFRKGQGSSFNGSLSTLISLFLFVYTKEVDPSSLTKQEILGIWKIAMHIDAKTFNLKRHIGGLLPYVSLIDTGFPVAYSGEAIYAHERFQVSSQTIKDNIVHTVDYSFADDMTSMGLEYAIIDSGLEGLPRSIKPHTQKFLTPFQVLPKVVRGFQEVDGGKLTSDLYQYYHALFLDTFLRYLQNPSLGTKMLLSVFKKLEVHETFDGVYQEAFYEVQKNKEHLIAFVSFSPSKGKGRYLCVTKKGCLSQYGDAFLHNLQKKTGWDVSFTYRSRGEGVSYGGASVEQYLSKKQYSSYIQEGTVVYTDMSGHRKIITLEEAIELSGQGFLLDGVSKKIWYNGKKLTSKDLLSQSTTVDLLLMLFDNLDQDVSNNALVRSSYSRNKNEMLSKVVQPFKKFVEKHTNMTLPLECVGGLYDYIIRLERSDIPFSSISRAGC